ncbi:MAG: hypothetical protein AAF193_00160 [Bacteroidota bacterium]
MKRALPYILILVATIVAFYQVAFVQHMLKWDNVDYFLPMRYFFHDALNNGTLPGWNPHINLGFPFYADPQSGAWYPILWVFKIMSLYGFKALNFEWLLHVFLGGVGMYRLSKFLKASQPIAVFTALAYALSGFMVGTAQILPFIIGACWLPWCLFCFMRILQRPDWKTATALALVLYMQITGAYPAFTIIVVYIFLIIFGMHVFRKAIDNKNLMALGLSAIITLLLCSGWGYSLLINFPDFGRSEALVYNETFTHNSFNLQSWWSFIAPYSTVTDKEFFNSDISLINGFIGISTLGLMVLAFFKDWRKSLWLLLPIVFFLLAADAQHFPIRRWLFNALPGMAHFKHPSIFRLYAMFFMILLSAKGGEYLMDGRAAFQRVFFFAIAMGFILIGVTYAGDIDNFKILVSQYFDHSEDSALSRHQHIGLQAMVFGSILLLAGVILLKLRSKWVLVVCIALEMISAAQINGQYTVFNKSPLGPNEKRLKELSLQAPDLSNKFVNVASPDVGMDAVWRNKSIFSGHLAYNGYNPFMQKSFLTLRDSKEMEGVISRPILSFAGEDVQNKVEWISHNGGDFSFKVNSTGPVSQLRFSQNFHPDWRLKVDGKVQTIQKDDNGLMQFSLNGAGDNDVELTFASNQYRLGIWMTLVGFLFTGLLLFFASRSLLASHHDSISDTQ